MGPPPAEVSVEAGPRDINHTNACVVLQAFCPTSEGLIIGRPCLTSTGKNSRRYRQD